MPPTEKGRMVRETFIEPTNSRLLGLFLSQPCNQVEASGRTWTDEHQRTDKSSCGNTDDGIVLTRWLLQLAFCLTACVHIPRALNHRLHRFRSLYACSGSLITNKTSEFPPKCITCCKQSNTQRHFNEKTSQCGITDKTGHFWAWDERETLEGHFSDTGPANKNIPNTCISAYIYMWE